MRYLRKTKGFTLLEVVIVIIIIGVLASLALPKLYAMVERSRAAEALVGISVIRSAMERCRLMNNGSYHGCCLNQSSTVSCGGLPWNTLDIEYPGSAPNSHFSYWVNHFSDYPTAHYHIIAMRRETDGVTPGKYDQCERTISYRQNWDVAGIATCNDPDNLYYGMNFGF